MEFKWHQFHQQNIYICIFSGHDYPLSLLYIVLIGIHHKTDRAQDPTITTSTSQSQLQAIPTLPFEAQGNSLLPFACLAPLWTASGNCAWLRFIVQEETRGHYTHPVQEEHPARYSQDIEQWDRKGLPQVVNISGKPYFVILKLLSPPLSPCYHVCTLLGVTK